MLGEAGMGGAPSATAVSSTLPFVQRLAQLVPLSDDDIAMLGELHANPRSVQKHRDIITEGRSYDSIHIILEGNAIRYRILHDGRRQIVNFVLPGDAIGILGSFTESSMYSVKALTEMAVATVPFARLNHMLATHPRLVA